MKDNVPVPLDRHIQHHPVIQGKVPRGQLGQPMELGSFQLRHKAHGADVYTQNGDPPFGGRLGHMQNRTVAAEANHRIGVWQFPLHPGEPDILWELKIPIHLKGQTHGRTHPCFPQNLNGAAHRGKIPVPVGIRCQEHVLHTSAPLSRVLWACSTTSATSGRIPGRSARVR